MDPIFATSGSKRTPDLGDIAQACLAATVPASLRADLAHEPDGARRLDALCASLIAAVFTQRGVFGGEPDGLSLDEVCGRLQARPGRRAHVRRLLEILEEDGWIEHQQGRARWRGRALPDADRIAADAASLEADFPYARGATPLLLRCVRGLPEVLSGALSGLAVLFAEGSISELEQLYSRLPLLALANAMAAAAVAPLAALWSDRGPGLRVLEVGAGTGALTASVLPALGAAVEHYVYTDISASFLQHGRRKFAHHPALQTRLLDIGEDPGAQGLAAASFDLVVAANVLHATPDIRRSIRHLRRTLRATGLLVLIETVVPSRFADCTVGLFDDWWSFRDVSLRPDYPLLGVASWQRLLHEEGFDVEVAPVGSSDLSSPCRVAVLIAAQRALKARAGGAAAAPDAADSAGSTPA